MELPNKLISLVVKCDADVLFFDDVNILGTDNSDTDGTGRVPAVCFKDNSFTVILGDRIVDAV